MAGLFLMKHHDLVAIEKGTGRFWRIQLRDKLIARKKKKIQKLKRHSGKYCNVKSSTKIFSKNL